MYQPFILCAVTLLLNTDKKLGFLNFEVCVVFDISYKLYPHLFVSLALVPPSPFILIRLKWVVFSMRVCIYRNVINSNSEML